MRMVGTTIATISAALCATLALATDIVIPYPPDWSTRVSTVHSMSDSAVAFAVYDDSGAAPPAPSMNRSLVIQHRFDGTESTTEFVGKVFVLSYSPDGRHLLVMRVRNRETEVSLVDSLGAILWSKDDYLVYDFSLSGKVIFAWWPGNYNPMDRGDTVEIFDLAGTHLKTVTFPSGDVRGVVVPGNGDEVIFFAKRAVHCLTTDPPYRTAWRYDFLETRPDAMGSYAFGPRHFVVEHMKPVSSVFAVDGTPLYVFDAQALGEADPLREMKDYARYRFTAGPTPESAMRFDGSDLAYSLDLATRALTPRRVDAAAPQGFSSSNRVDGKHLFMRATDRALVRTFE